MQLVIAPQGDIRCIYGEKIDLHALGKAAIVRGSHVEPDHNGRWFADLSPVGGPVLGPFHQRTQALQAEYAWLETNWIVAGTGNDRYQGDLFLSHPRQCENENRESTKEFDGLRWREMRLKE